MPTCQGEGCGNVTRVAPEWKQKTETMRMMQLFSVLRFKKNIAGSLVKLRLNHWAVSGERISVEANATGAAVDGADRFR